MRKILFISFIILLVGCSTAMKFSNLDSLRLGMSHSAASQSLSAKPTKTFQAKVSNKSYTVDVYRVMNGEYSANYFLAYDASGNLVYWGYPNEFERSQNVILNEIGSQVVKQLG